MIQLSDIRKKYVMGPNEVPVLNGIDLSIQKGEMVSIMGASGSGKTTLLNIIGVLDSFDQGTYRFNGEVLAGIRTHRLPLSSLPPPALQNRARKRGASAPIPA